VLFGDRSDAGRRLAARLNAWRGRNPVVLALPRGGVPIGFEIARVLRAPLDLVLVRKIGAPGEPEFAIGAVSDGDRPELVLDEQLVARLGITRDYIEDAKAAEVAELERRRSVYLKGRPPVPVTGRPVIVVDDGIATGATMLSALRATRRRDPAHLLLAVPVAPRDVVRRLRRTVDEIVCLHTPKHLSAVGAYYRAFPQLCDGEVIALLDRATQFHDDGKPCAEQ
jgi:putative phosphoribosyl transferase